MTTEREKRAAAETAATLVENGMTVGLGTGSTVAFLRPALARRSLDNRCVATSVRTEHDSRQLGLRVETFEDIDRFDVAIDGADQIAPDGWRVKGGGGAHTREKLVAAAADRFVVIADSSKPVQALRGPIPLELLSFGLQATLRRIGPVSLRDVPASPDGGVITDYQGPADEPATLAGWLTSLPGVVEHGLFPPEMVSTVLVGRTTLSTAPTSYGGSCVLVHHPPTRIPPMTLRYDKPLNLMASTASWCKGWRTAQRRGWAPGGQARGRCPPQPRNTRISTRRPTGERPDGEGA
jgi:ribose 5-phosphate isomerase A